MNNSEHYKYIKKEDIISTIFVRECELVLS